MSVIKKRRKFLKQMLSLPLLATPGMLVQRTNESSPSVPSVINNHRLKTSLNAFSFNDPLLSGKMSLDDLLQVSAEIGFNAVDITAYYFPGYPEVPSDAALYDIKRKAFNLGLEISGTGVRNDFTEPDKSKRAESIKLVKAWIVAAEKLGAPVIRIFAGNQIPAGFSRSQVMDWMLKDIAECVAYGKEHGVVVAIQNHNDFIQTADDAIEFIKRVNSNWFGLILDTGSYRVGDPYAEIEKTAKYAVNWQVKENVFIGGVEVPTDLPKLISIIKASGYKGYLPIETLGKGDPKTKVTDLYAKLSKALA